MKKANPAALAKRTGLIAAPLSERSTEPNTTNQNRAEDFAALYVAKRFHLSPCVARVVAALAQLGGRI